MFYGLRAAGVDQWWSLLLSGVVPAVVVIVRFVRTRTVDFVALFVLSVVALSLGISAMTGDARTMLIRDAWGGLIGGLIGVWLLVSVWVGRPALMSMFRSFVLAKVGPEGLRTWESRWDTDAAFRHGLRLLTFVWGCASVPQRHRHRCSPPTCCRSTWRRRCSTRAGRSSWFRPCSSTSTTPRSGTCAHDVTDVIVAGAGPTGLMLAGELALGGARVVVLEQLAARTGQSKALNLQPRSAEVLASRGLLDDLLAVAPARLPRGHFAGIPLDYSQLPTPYPYQIGIPQARVEERLADWARSLGAEIRYGEPLESFEPGRRRGDGERRARRLPGRLRRRPQRRPQAARRAVSRAGTPGCARWSPTSRWPAAARPSGSCPRRRATGCSPCCRWATASSGCWPPARPRWRPAGTPRCPTTRSPRPWPATASTLGEVRWASRFTDTTRQAARYRTGRVFLAGDAAHVHSPAGGQGLNLGLQDAFNLGWKLAEVIRGESGDDLLDTYHAERHPVAARVLESTRAQGVLFVPDEDVPRAPRGVHRTGGRPGAGHAGGRPRPRQPTARPRPHAAARRPPPHRRHPRRPGHHPASASSTVRPYGPGRRRLDGAGARHAAA